jgi:hypothetical protein
MWHPARRCITGGDLLLALPTSAESYSPSPALGPGFPRDLEFFYLAAAPETRKWKSHKRKTENERIAEDGKELKRYF